MAVQLKTLNGYEFNASALGGVNAEEYIQKSEMLTLEEIQASTNLSGKIPSASALRDVDSRFAWKLVTTFTETATNVVDDLTNYNELYAIAHDEWAQNFFSPIIPIDQVAYGTNVYMTSVAADGTARGIIIRINSATEIENATFIHESIQSVDIFAR